MSKPKNIRSASVLSMMTSSKSPEGQFGFFYIFSDIYSTWGMKIGQKMNVKSIVKNRKCSGGIASNLQQPTVNQGFDL